MIKNSPNSHKLNSGSILIVLLIIIACAVTIALTVNELAVDNFTRVKSCYIDRQSAIYANTAIKAIVELIKEHNTYYDSPKDTIFNIPEIPVNGGTIEIKVVPLNGKINLNLLKTGLKKQQVRCKKALDYILEQHNINSSVLDELMLWVGARPSYGTFSAEWSSGASYKGKPLDTLYELNYIPRCSGLYNTLRHSFTVLSQGGSLNINFADVQTIKAYLPEIASCAQKIVNYRKISVFKNISAIRLACTIPDQTYIKLVPFITVHSSYFYVKIKTDIDSVTHWYHYVLKQEQNSVKIVRYIEAGKYDYF